MDYFDSVSLNYNWRNPISIIKELSCPEKYISYTIIIDKFFKDMAFNNFPTLQSLRGSFKKYCSIIFKNFLPEKYISKIIECLFDDFAIELLDICLFHISQKSVATRTAREKLAYSNSYAKLGSHLHNLLTKPHTNEYWSFFLATNIINNKGTNYALKLYGAPAIIASIKMEEQIGVTPENFYTNMTVFQNSFSTLLAIINDSKNDWKAYLSKTIPNPVEFTSYHLEKIWRYQYIDTLINAFSKPRIGAFILPSQLSFKGSSTPLFHTFSSLEKDDLEIYRKIIELLTNDDSNIQTKLFLTQYLFKLRIDPNIFDTKPITSFISYLIPLLKEFLYYCVFRQCITKKMSGHDLYLSIYEYCKTCSSNALKRCYSISNFQCKTKALNNKDRSTLESYFTMCNFKNSQAKLIPKDLQKSISERYTMLNNCVYSPHIFEDINIFNELNK